MLQEFRDRFRKVKVIQCGSGQRVRGEWVEKSTAPVERDMIPSAMTPSRLKHLPEGRYSTEDMKFYATGSREWNKEDVIIYKDTRYVIRDITDRSELGNMTAYFAKREVKA